MAAENDWIVAGINNPTFTNADFSNIAKMTVDNTQLLDKDFYKKQTFIKENDMFKDENGKFSERKFENYYNARVAEFGTFQQDDFYKGPALDIFDTDRVNKPDARLVDPGLNIMRGYNPDRQAIGIEGLNKYSDPEFSQREIAQQNKVFNYEKGEFENYSPNDHALTKSPIQFIKDLFKEPLVLATWDEDGTHVDPFTGMEVQHYKGENKLNDKGTYYYETLGGRSTIGKEVLSLMDNLTAEGQAINKYDFFDSDDIKKSVGGTIMNNVASILPMFCAAPISTVYAAMRVAKGLAMSAPMLYGMASTLVGDKSESPAWINNISAYASRMARSTSDWAKSHTFCAENFINLFGEVANQYGEQMLIAKAVGGLKGSNKIIQEAQEKVRKMFNARKAQFAGNEAELMRVCENMFMPDAYEASRKAGQLGRDLSLAYMALVSNQDVYEQMLEHGTTKKEAAIVTLGSTLGMFAVDKYLGLGELFFDDATSDAVKEARVAIRNEIKNAKGAFETIATAETDPQRRMLKFMKKGSDLTKNAMNRFADDLKYHTTTLAGKMFGEGLEEVSEELVTDINKQLYEIAGDFGFDTTTNDVGAWDDAFNRYMMNFLGGVAGGGIFYGREVLQGRTFHRPKDDMDVATVIRNGHVKELRDELTKVFEQGKTGNKNLSARYTEDLPDGTRVWRTKQDGEASQAEAVYRFVGNRINAIEEIITGNRFNLSDDELFKNMVLSEKRYEAFKNVSDLTDYYQTYTQNLNTFVQAELDYAQASKTIEGTVDGTVINSDQQLRGLTEEQKAVRDEKLNELKNKSKEAKKVVEDYLSGDNSLEYTRLMNFAMDPVLHLPFLNIDKASYCESLYHKKLEQLTPEELAKFENEQWPDYYQTQLRGKLMDGYKSFKEFEKKVNPSLKKLSESSDEYKKWKTNIDGLFKSGALDVTKLFNSYWKKDAKIEGESDEEFENRGKKIVDKTTGNLESDEDYISRVNERNRKINEHNEKLDKDFADRIEAELKKVNYRVDPLTARMLRKALAGVAFAQDESGAEFNIVGRGRLRGVINRIVSMESSDNEMSEVMMELGKDLSNVEELKNVLYRKSLKNIKHDIDSMAATIFATKIKLKDGNEKTIGDYLLEKIMEDEEAEGDLGESNLESVREVLDEQIGDKSSNTMFSDLDDESLLRMRDKMTDVQNYSDELYNDMNLREFVSGQYSSIDNVVDDKTYNGEARSYEEKIAQDIFKEKNKTIDKIVNDISDNPLFKLQGKIESSVVNPVVEMLKEIAKNNGDELPNLEGLLWKIQDDFDNLKDVRDLILNENQRAELERALDYMDLLSVYLYAASTVPNQINPIGHNRTINAFARDHADKLQKAWAKLPEVPSDLAFLYQNVMEKYRSEINDWIRFSNNNSFNKVRSAIQTDTAFNKALYDALMSIDRNFTVNVGGEDKKVDLLDGVDRLDLSSSNSDMVQVALCSVERLVRNNVVKYAKENNMSVVEFVRNTGLEKAFVKNIGIIDGQRQSRIDDEITMDRLSDFDKLMYFAALMSEDPAKYYSDLKVSVNENQNKAPLTVQEFVTRLAVSSLNNDFKEILEIFHNKYVNNKETPFLSHSFIISGVAGAGKTFVVLSNIASMLQNQNIIIAAPTPEQTADMRSTLGIRDGYSFAEVLKNFYGEEQYLEIMSELENAKPSKQSNDPPFEGKYMSIKTGSDGMTKVSLKKEALVVKQVETVPKAFFIDEATHMSTVEALLFDHLGEEYGAEIFLCGDIAQNGFKGGENMVSNIEAGSVFAARSPEMNLSLRENNIQKFGNNSMVRSLIDFIVDKKQDLAEGRITATEYEALSSQIGAMIGAMKFRLYKDNDINGDWISSTLTEEIKSKLKALSDNGAVIGFIGDANSSVLADMKSYGIKIDEANVYTEKSVQGHEFDYVVSDIKYSIGQKTESRYRFLKQIYTIMTRARNATIMIDQNLPVLFGENVISHDKSKAPTIDSAIKQLIEKKMKVLDAMDLSVAQETMTDQSVNAEESTAQNNDVENNQDLQHDVDQTQEANQNTETDSEENKTDVSSESGKGGPAVSFVTSRLKELNRQMNHALNIKPSAEAGHKTDKPMKIAEISAKILRNNDYLIENGVIDSKGEIKDGYKEIETILKEYNDLIRKIEDYINDNGWEIVYYVPGEEYIPNDPETEGMITVIEQIHDESLPVGKAIYDSINQCCIIEKNKIGSSTSAKRNVIKPARVVIRENFVVDDNEADTSDPELKTKRNYNEDFKDPDSRTDVDNDIKTELAKRAVEDDVQYNNAENAEKDYGNETNDSGTFSEHQIHIEGYSKHTPLGATGREISKKNEITGSTVKGIEYRVEIPTSGILRNLQAISETTRSAFWFTEKQDFAVEMAKVKSALLFDYSYDSLPSFITEHFTEEEWTKNGRYELEFRPVTENDTLPAGTNLKEGAGFTYPLVNEDGTRQQVRLICDIVYTVKNKKGRVCKFDVAGINSPETLINNSKGLKDGLTKQIDSYKFVDQTDEVKAEVERLKRIRASYDITPFKYNEWFKDRIREYLKGGSKPMSIDINDAVLLTGRTWLVPRGVPIRLGGSISPDTMSERDVHALKRLNPELVFSDVYLLTGNENDFLNIDPSLAGKSVVFVTSDALADPDSIIDDYIAQKKDPANNTARVRMLVLDTYGASFSQLANDEFQETFGSVNRAKDSSAAKIPIKQSFMGLRQFVSMWNARASLGNLIGRAQKFVNDHNDDYGLNSINDLNVIAQAAQILYRKSSDFDKARKVLKDAGLKIDPHDAQSIIRNFNLSLGQEIDGEDTSFENVLQSMQGSFGKEKMFSSKSIKENVSYFRIGYAENEKGIYVQKIPGETPDKYYCMLSVDKAVQYYKLLDLMLNTICPSSDVSIDTVLSSLGNRFYVMREVTDSEGKKKEEKVALLDNEYIEFDEAKHRRTLSGLLHKGSKGSINISTGKGKESRVLAYAEGKEWSSIPYIIERIAAWTRYYQINPDQLSSEGFDEAGISYSGHDSMGNLIDKKVRVPMNGLVGYAGGEGGLLKVKTSDDAKVDESLYDVLDIVFHGTTQDIHDSSVLKVTDAYFKDGFKIDPKATYEKTTKGSSIVAILDGKNRSAAFKANVNEALYTSDKDISGPSIGLDFNVILFPEKYRKAINRIKKTRSGGSVDTVLEAEKRFRELRPGDAQLIDEMKGIVVSPEKINYSTEGLYNAAYEANYIIRSEMGVEMSENDDFDVSRLENTMMYVMFDGKGKITYDVSKAKSVSKMSAFDYVVKLYADHFGVDKSKIYLNLEDHIPGGQDVYIKYDGKKYKFDFMDIKAENIFTPKSEVGSLFDENFEESGEKFENPLLKEEADGMTDLDALIEGENLKSDIYNELLNSSDYSEDINALDEDANSFVEKIMELSAAKNAEEYNKIQDEIINDNQFEYIRDYLIDKKEELYDRIFGKKCGIN